MGETHATGSVSKGLPVIGALLAILLFVLCLGSSTFDLLILHSMHTRGSFHGTVFSVQRTIYSAVICFVAASGFLAIRSVRSWLKANPPNGIS